MFSNEPRRPVVSSISAADVAVRRDDAELDPRLLDRLDLADVGELGRVVDGDPAAVHRQLHAVLDRRRATR